MLELEVIARAAHVLGKLVGLGVSAWKAKDAPVGADDLGLLRDAASTTSELAGKKGSVRPPARQVALLAAAFGEAWRHHWALGARPRAGDLNVAWTDYLTSSAPQRNLLAEGSARLKNTLRLEVEPEVLRAAEELAAHDALAGDPLGTPTYRALFRAFAGEGPDGEPPLLMLRDEERVDFERAFRRAYHEVLATPEGAEVRAWLLGLVEDRAGLVRQLLVADLAGWGARHVFGNALEHESLGAMPLERVYVEPLATTEREVGARKQRSGPRAVQKLLSQLTAKNPVVLVVADFGLGKSLTARHRAWELARTYLAGAVASPELELPVFIRCADDLASGEVDVERMVRRALQRHARELGLELPLNDAALATPSPEVRVCYLLDGLDEVALSERQMIELFRGLREHAGAKHRFIVFSRPAALPPWSQLRDVPRVRLTEFTHQSRDKQPGGQVGEWLERWNALRPGQPPLTVHDLARAKLLDLAVTPILLFMIAYTWDAATAGSVTQVELYERFFGQVARGKHQLDRATHPQIAAASERLRDALIGRGLLAASDGPVEAMLWLLGRAAWESARRHELGEPLSSSHLERVVREELGIVESAEAVRAIRTSLLLVLQAELDGGEVRLLFGHRSFEEFLVARHWADVLRRIARSPSSAWATLEAELGGARLRECGKAPELLRNLLFAWDDGARAQLHAWASWSFNAEHPAEDDRHAPVREAALYLGSTLPDGPGIAARTPLTLRRLLAWFWLHGKEPRLHAARLRSPEARLDGANLVGAWMDHANLRRASLVGAKLNGAHLFRADLSQAKLDGANAMHATLDEANLESAYLRETFLSGACLRQARLARAMMPLVIASGADFDRADLSGANLKAANLERAILRGATLCMADLDRARLALADLSAADLSRASLQGADLRRATLQQANFQEADLREAKLRDADLRGADLRRADLTGADLEGADLHGADLRDAILEGARRPDFTGAVR